MITRRRIVIALGAGALAAPLASFAQQQSTKVYRIGFLGSASASDPSSVSRTAAFRAGLRELGYEEGKNVVIEFRWAEGKYGRLPDFAAELVRLKVDVIVTHGTPGARAAMRATTTIPIVVATVGDAIASGLVTSLARPGGNVTGSTYFDRETVAKRLEVLRDALPRTRRVGVLLNATNPVSPQILQAMSPAAKSLKMELQQFGVRGPEEFNGAFSAMVAKRVDAVMIYEDAMLIGNAKAAMDAALITRLPSIGRLEFAEAGGLMAYGVNVLEMWRRAAIFVDKILKGAKPGDLPVERATRFELVINMKTAKTLGLKIPNSILVRADRVIE